MHVRARFGGVSDRAARKGVPNVRTVGFGCHTNQWLSTESCLSVRPEAAGPSTEPARARALAARCLAARAARPKQEPCPTEPCMCMCVCVLCVCARACVCASAALPPIDQLRPVRGWHVAAAASGAPPPLHTAPAQWSTKGPRGLPLPPRGRCVAAVSLSRVRAVCV